MRPGARMRTTLPERKVYAKDAKALCFGVFSISAVSEFLDLFRRQLDYLVACDDFRCGPYRRRDRTIILIRKPYRIS